MLFSTIIIQHAGRSFRFQRQEQELVSQVCYWKGVVKVPTAVDGSYQAYVEQKYAPYRQFWAESAFKSEAEALNWVATHLAQDEE